MALVTACLLVHAYQSTLDPAAQVAFQDSWGLTPAYLAVAPSFHEAITLVTALFVHQSLGALLANLAVLGIAGPRVERAIGAPGLLAFFLVSGAVGGLWLTVTQSGTIVPSCGAHMAVAGVAIACLVNVLSGLGYRPPRAPGPPSARYAGMAS